MDEQIRLDIQRRTYRVAFPSDIRAQDVQGWLRQVASGLHTRGEGRAQPSLVFDVVSHGGDLAHYLSVPWKDADHVVQQLHGHVPRTSTTLEDGRPRMGLTFADEFELYDADTPLDLQAESMSRYVSILNSMNRIEAHEAIALQWCVRPIHQSELPNLEFS